MIQIARARLAIKYISFEILPTLIMGLSVFILVLVMFQSFNLSEYIIVHGVKIETVSKLVFYIMLGYLPMLLPIALLFAILMVYGRMSGDSEIVAFKALGLSSTHLLIPAMIIGAIISLLSLQTSFRLAPWGNRNLDSMINVLAQTKPGSALREGVFSQGFFDLVVYANKIDSNNGILNNIFIFDERDPSSPTTIIAKEGHIVNKNSITGNEAYLHLLKGNLHKSNEEVYTKIDFGSYKINLFDPHKVEERQLPPDSLNLAELNQALQTKEKGTNEYMKLLLEWHRRWSLSFTCFVFALLGFSISAITNRRTARSGSIVICISAVVIYWTLQMSCEAMVRKGVLPAAFGTWLANFIFLFYSIFLFRRMANT